MPGVSKRKSSGEVSLSRLIDDVVVNDEEWSCLVIMLIETRDSQTSYIASLNDACEDGNRKAVRLINREKMLAKLRMPVKGDSSCAVKQSPSVQQIRQFIRANLRQRSPSSDTVVDEDQRSELGEAALIKWMIYEVRLEWLARRALEQEEPQPKTKLRRRGEEWRDRVYVDDAPENGPDMYILLTGFHEPNLPSELIDSQVPLKCILRLDDFHSDDVRRDSSVSDLDTSNGTKSDCQCDCQCSSDSDEPLNFWREFDKSQCPDLGIRSFCPPRELHDLYDRISCVLYDAHELVQAHAAYLCAMKVIHVYESRPAKQIASGAAAAAAYEDHLSATTVERTTVARVVEAMLRQVEQSFADEDDFFGGQEEQTHESQATEEEESSRQTSLSGVNSTPAFARLTEKLRLLNLKYELISDQAELILRHGDSLLLSVCRANDDSCDFDDLPAIAETCRTRDLAEVELCNLHLPGIFMCAEGEGIKRPKAKHLLNLLGLRKMLREQESAKPSNSSSVKDSYYLIKLDDRKKNGKIETLRHRNRSQSEVENNNKLTVTSSIFQNFSYETKQVYRVKHSNNISSEKLETPRNNEDGSNESLLKFDCNQMRSKGNVTNLNEKLGRKKVYDGGTSSSSDTSCRCVEPRYVARSTELEEARRLSSLEATSLLRSFESCRALFGLIDARESLGLEAPPSSSSRGYPPLEFAELLASPWTVLECFHSYAHADVRYFAPTDSLLLAFYDERPGRVAERRVTCALRTPLCLRDFCEYVVDEERDWLQRRRSSSAAVSESRAEMTDEKYEEVAFKDEDFFLPCSLKAIRLEELRNEEWCNAGEEGAGVKNAPSPKASSSSTPSSKNNGLKAEPTTFEFIGYDLGTTSRVQVTNLASSYEARDGTRLRLTRDTWLHDDAKETTTTTRVEIEVPDCCSLRYHETLSRRRHETLFHLTTNDGIVVAFARKPHRVDEASRAYELAYDVQISWPSGLIVKPMEYPDADQPLYVLQYHSSRDFRCESIANETHRKYLRNGDVVKFFNDRSIVVLRPNGTVITVEPPSLGDRVADGNSIGSWEKYEDVGISGETSFLLRQSSSEWEQPGELRYEVLELDGRRYEVVDGRVVRELDRLRAHLMEEYSAREKFARRADGTDALFTSDAELIVSFPDGTRTLSTCTIEEEEEEDNGFVLVSLHNRAEHPWYASVAGHRLSMPRQLEFQLDELRLECGNEARVELGSASVSISRPARCECSPTSQASFDLAARDDSTARLVELRDKARRLLLTVWREDARFELTPETCEQSDCNDEKPRRCRTFALSRDGSTTREYLHRSILRRDFLQEMFDDPQACLIRREWDDGIVGWLGMREREECTMEYKIRKARPSVVDEEDELPFKAPQRQRFLRARLVEGIDDDENSSLISMQRALLRYWREVATGRGKAFEAGTAITCECRGEIESWMRDVALGRVGTIDPESYEAGREELKKMRAEEDEERTRRMIDRSYARDSPPETDVLGGDNE